MTIRRPMRRALSTMIAQSSTEDQCAEAIARFEQALRIEDREPLIYFNLGSALAQVGREEEAIANVRRALVFDPEFTAAHRFLCIALARRGRESEAAPHCAAAGGSAGP